MRRARLTVLAVLVALIVGALPAAAVTNDWGNWTFTGHGKSWSGTFFSAHRVTGFVMGTTSLVKNNAVTSLKIGSHTCKISTERGTGYCYSVGIPTNKKLKWTATTRHLLSSSNQLVPCIQYNKKFHCRYGNG